MHHVARLRRRVRTQPMCPMFVRRLGLHSEALLLKVVREPNIDGKGGREEEEVRVQGSVCYAAWLVGWLLLLTLNHRRAGDTLGRPAVPRT